jgi:hypothetical protein
VREREAADRLVRASPTEVQVAGDEGLRWPVMGYSGPDARAEQVKGLAQGSADWLVEHADAEGDSSLYNGQAGVVLALQEAAHVLVEPRYGRAVAAGLERLVAAIGDVQDSSLYFGLAGVAFAVWALDRPDDAMRALGLVRSRFDGQRWGPMFELLSGNAGVGLAALHAGDLELAVMAVIPYLTSADHTAHGVHWPVRPTPPRSHHIAHGTLGIVHALAAIGDAAGRDDLVELALAGAADVVSRNEAGADGFLVAHSDPPHRPDLIERYSFGWCNGPAGDAQVFRLLAKVTKDSDWTALVDRCWHTVTESGLPRRVRPGFWDNNGRCCGTAGVLALACDRIVEQGDDWTFADVLVDDLTAHATVDEAGVRWSNYEHRATPPTLPPRPGWAMGNAGIVRELLRYAKLRQGGSGTYSIQWPDQPVVDVHRSP